MGKQKRVAADGPTFLGKADRVWLGALLFSSGALALVYEMLWYRQFSFLFGSAATASAAILVAYFAGLGIGSLLCGKWVGRWRNPWLAYGVLELCIGMGALGVTPLLSVFSGNYAELASSGAAGAGNLLLLKGILGFAAIAVPTIAMGGTLPVLAELVDLRKEHPGRRVGWLYVVNTSGAALGALAFPFLLLSTFGMRKTAGLCAALNFSIAAMAFLLGRRSGSVHSYSHTTESTRVKTAGQQLAAPLLLAFISGAGTFALQVLWNRAFAQIHENSLSSFALIVTVFIISIALGAELARVLLQRFLNTKRVLATFWIAGGLLTLISPQVFIVASNHLEYLPTSGVNPRLVLIATSVILLPVTLLSCGMPLLFHNTISESDRSTGNSTGLLLAANTGGSIAGALLAGFVLPKALGMWNAAISVGLVYMVSAGCLLFKDWKSRLLAVGSIAFLGCLLLRTDLPRTRIDAKSGNRLIALTEGAHGIVAVMERSGSRQLKLNNHYLLGGTSAIGDERMQAHIPLLLHPDPRTAAFLGYGTGITAGGATFHPGVAATGIELVPEVGLFASRYFKEANLDFGSNNTTRLIIDDARAVLRVSARKFDVIVGDLVVPWRPGEASLYTQEHFAMAKNTLNENGLLCVWVPMFQLSEPEFKIILNTFLAEFDQAVAWRGDFSPTAPALALIGFKGKGLDSMSVAVRLAKMNPDPSNPQLRFASTCWMHLIGVINRNHLDPSERRINSENLPWLELRERASKTSHGPSKRFVGRDLQGWEMRVREDSRRFLTGILSADSVNGWEAGGAMAEFTLLLREGRQAEARAAQLRIRQMIADDAYKAVFGEGP